jgi:glycosyltransferase involved in cell wall biosynthesis
MISDSNFPKITVVTPSYNQADYLEETILSILDQGYPNLEFIIIDGGSTDASVEIIKKYESQIFYWESVVDRGQAHALNKGFERSTGEVFAYLNSDDCYHKNTLKIIAEAYLKQKENANFLFIGDCFWGESFVDNKGFLDQPNFPDSLEKALYKRGLAPQASMFWTKKNVDVKFYEQLRFCMDHEFWLQLILNNYKIVRINENLSLFRQHPLSKTHTISHVLDQELNGLNSIYLKYIKTENQIRLRLTNLAIENQKVSQNLLNSYKNKELGLFEILSSHLSVELKVKTFLKAILGYER